MSFELTSSQINTLHVSVWGGGVPRPLENHRPGRQEAPRAWAGGEDKAKGLVPKKGEPSGEGLAEPILLQQFLQGFVSSCRVRVHYWLWVRLVGWRGQPQENGNFFEVAGKGATCE